MRYKVKKASRNLVKHDKTYEGETIEAKMRRVINNKEPITDGAPIIFTERKDGVRPEYDIRTDRFEIAVDAMDAVHKAEIARREERIGERAKANMEKEGKTEKTTEGKQNGGAESTQGTEGSK